MGKRVDELGYPIIAIREAILNALVNRDFSIHSEGGGYQYQLLFIIMK